MKPMSTGFCWAPAANEASASMMAALPPLMVFFMVVSSCVDIFLLPDYFTALFAAGPPQGKKRPLGGQQARNACAAWGPSSY